MTLKTKAIQVIIFAALSSSAFAAAPHQWYLSASAGIFQGLFNTQYNDQTDIIPQNFRQPVTQNSYVGGLAVGYSRACGENYFWGGELGIYGATYHANFAAGASNAAFSDTLAIDGNIDLSFVPGFFITDTLSAYGKAGLSYARVTATVNSPAGFVPTFSSTNNTNNTLGAVLGLGFKKSVANNAVVFAEYNYHDYGTVNFSSFQNFTATYSHSAHVYSQSVAIGASYLL